MLDGQNNNDGGLFKRMKGTEFIVGRTAPNVPVSGFWIGNPGIDSDWYVNFGFLFFRGSASFLT